MSTSIKKPYKLLGEDVNIRHIIKEGSKSDRKATLDFAFRKCVELDEQ